MEEIRFKLKRGTPPVAEAAVEKLLEAALKSGSSTAGEELALLWEEVKSPLPFVSSACSSAIVALCLAGVVDPAAAISGFLSTAPQVRGCTGGLVAAVANLAAETEKKKKEQQQQQQQQHFSFSSSPHPFVSLLRSIPECWPHVHAEVRRRMTLSPSTCPLHFRSVFVYSFCDPHHHPHLAGLRVCLLDVLLEAAGREEGARRILRLLLTWFNFGRPSCFYENCRHAVRILRRLQDGPNSSLPVLLALALQGFSLGVDPGELVEEARAEVEAGQGVLTKTTAEVALLLLARAVEATLSEAHSPVLELCRAVVAKFKVQRTVLGVALAAVLQSLPHRRKLPPSASDFVRTLLDSVARAEDTWEDKADQDDIVEGSFFLPHHAEAVHTLRLAYAVSTDEEAASWLEDVEKLGNLPPPVVRVLLSLTAVGRDDGVVNRSFALLVRGATESPSLTHSVVAVAMHKLANKDRSASPATQLHFVRQLSSLGNDKSCISFVLQLVKSLGSRPGLIPLRLQLLFRLWKAEERIYPYLKGALEEVPPEATVRSEFRLSRAKVVRDVCLTHAHVHGPDLLPILSAILNECLAKEETTTPESVPAAVMALEGIAHLCSERVIDVRTTLEVLGPKLWEVDQEAVIKAFLRILEVVPTFDLSSDLYLDFRRSTLEGLWKRLSAEPRPAVRSAAFKAISSFQLRDHTLAAIPSYAKTQLKFPADYVPPSEDLLPPPRPEDVLTFVPGSCWTSLLCDSSAEDLEGCVQVVRALLREEVLGLPRGVYFLQPTMRNKGEEPANLNGLPDSSVLRALVSYLLSVVGLSVVGGKVENKKMRAKAVADLLSTPLGRPLPPFDWLLLEPLEWKADLIRIAALQSSTSR